MRSSIEEHISMDLDRLVSFITQSSFVQMTFHVLGTPVVNNLYVICSRPRANSSQRLVLGRIFILRYASLECTLSTSGANLNIEL